MADGQDLTGDQKALEQQTSGGVIQQDVAGEAKVAVVAADSAGSGAALRDPAAKNLFDNVD